MGRNGNSRQLREGPYLLAISNDRCYFKEAPFSLENNNCIILAMLTGHETKNVRRSSHEATVDDSPVQISSWVEKLDFMLQHP